ncbi:PAS domain S-box protein [Rhodovulum sulfidophilum]|uniref:sensor histidine kinase n=1 Tax=Rhodovulum sulfidophilum TaxID=35806 RepID=UPI001924FB79|nr:PAS domain S-box protein [Rhodovulum sulfidophilum]MBL3575444.1 PAS domain S-box protein [Rhodovulum sulfidophilum]MCE8431143.1 PAS domain S-box protein [Rhodovulum sulfidophilum]MCF4117544.1 PAS domain S-box protein [Rhodovulum sulfidophilum]
MPIGGIIARRRLGLSAKLALLALVVVLTATLVFSAVTLFGSQWYRQAALSRMEFAGAFFSERVLRELELMASDAGNLSVLPEIGAVADGTTRGANGTGSDDEGQVYWRKRLEAVFESVLLTRPHYTQVRYIGREDNWREIVRVHRVGDRIEVVAPGGMQSKGNEPYLADRKALNAGLPFFSRITPNHEHGSEVGPPTIRFVVPVLGTAGTVGGALVINADFEWLLRAANLHPSDGFSVTVMTSSNDYMIFDPVTGPGRLRFHDTPEWNPAELPDLAGIGGDDMADTTEIGWRRAVNVTSLPSGSPNRGDRLSLRTDIFVVTELPTRLLFAPLRQQLFCGLAAAIVLSVGAASVAWIIGKQLTAPLHRLAQGLRKCDLGEDMSDLIPTTNDEVGELARALVSLNDRLYQKSTKLNAIFSEAADGLITISEAGVIEEVNAATARIFGYDAADMVGRNVSILMSEEDAERHNDMLRRRIGRREQKRLIAGREVAGVRKDGTQIIVEISVASARQTGGSRYIGVIRDVTSRHEQQARSEALVKALERSNADLDAFAYFASHDLKAPLRVIDNASAWLEEDLAPYLNEDTRDSMDLLRSRVARMERLLDDLLNHSRIGRIEEKAQIVEGRDLFDELRGLLQIPDGFSFEATPDFMDLRIPNMPIKTVLLNLLGNSLKHHDRETGFVRLSGYETDTAYHLSVTDDGPGIPPKYHAKVFEMFQTLRPRDEVEASGMGLAMVLKHIQLAGGEVRIDSDGSRGTTINLVWPKAARADKATGRAA